MARVVALVPDLFFAAKVRETLTSAGHEVELVRTHAEAVGADADLVIVDLDADDINSGVLVSDLLGTPTLGFYSHVNEETKHAGRLAGIDVVVPRSRMAREMPKLVENLVAS
ncbi:MAG: hypothetical protein WDZ37_07375 [Solirubrobacterales bacterium]